ncbi:MAG TPA: hypothetical protein VGC18_03560, partial [Lacisediminihabitans sp.]|uniref:hypothetical protein n=1 Tax=Lacisediminihabitans sp. TaxID=2787631 RepID=UPI002ED98824
MPKPLRCEKARGVGNHKLSESCQETVKLTDRTVSDRSVSYGRSMSTSSEDLRAIALAEFTTAGYAATSLH